MRRRDFLGLGAAVVTLPIGAGIAQLATPPGDQAPSPVRAGEDREGVHKTLGISTIDFKVTARDSGGAMLMIENTNRAKGGPARHLHFAQDEVFHVVAGEYVIEIGTRRFELRPGDTILAPRRVPHVWAYVGEAVGQLLITFTPPGRMEAFFHAVSRTNGMPAQDPALWRAHGMELLGPPLPV